MWHLNMLGEAEKEVDSGKGFRLTASSIAGYSDMGIIVKCDDLSVIGIDS